MSQKNKRVKLGKIQEEIAGVLGMLDQVEAERLELYESADTLEIKLSELRQKESKLIAKIKPV